VIPPLGPAAGSRRAAVREREELVVTRLQSLAPQLDGEPDPGFRARTRARLVAMAAVRERAPEPVSPLKRLLTAPEAPARWRTRLTAGLAGAALTVTALAGVVAVSADAGPGDALYGVKRGTEATQLALASDARRGQTLLEFASTRLAELGDLLRGGDTDPALVTETLAAMDRQTRDGAAWQGRLAVERHDQAPLHRLGAWSDSQFAGLLALRPEIPAAAKEQYIASLSVLDGIGLRVDGLSAALACAGGPATRGTDVLGPVPASCPPLQAAPGDSGPGGGAPSVPAGTGAQPSPGAGGTGGATPGSSGGGSTGSGGSGAGLPGAPGTPTGGPGLPTGVPVPTIPLPSVSVSVPLPSGGLPGQEPQPKPSASSPGFGICVPGLKLPTC
jgi:uncharacterized membrane protein YgcG